MVVRKKKNEGKKIWSKREKKSKRGERKIVCRKVREKKAIDG